MQAQVKAYAKQLYFRDNKCSFMLQKVTTPIPPPPKNPHLRSMVPVKPLLSRGSALHSEMHEALFRSASIWIPETEAHIKLQMLLKHRLCLAPCFAYAFFPLQDKQISVDVLSLKQLQCDVENQIVSYKTISYQQCTCQSHECY